MRDGQHALLIYRVVYPWVVLEIIRKGTCTVNLLSLAALVQTDCVEDAKEDLARASEVEASSLFTTGKGFIG